jgi:CRP/FNR family transcriptional regulator
MEQCIVCAIRSRAVETLNDEEFIIHQNNCAELDLEAGESLFKEGQLSSHIAYLKTGLAKIHKRGVKGSDQILKIVKPARYIGLQTILSNKVHQYSASVIEKSTVCYIDITSFKGLITRNAKFANELILYLCQDELSYFERFVNVHQKQIDGRLADTILFFADEVRKSDSFTIPLSRADLAALVCATRESVTRALKDLIDIGTIKVHGRQFEILNKKLLTAISKNG